jgi:hypothetical protein
MRAMELWLLNQCGSLDSFSENRPAAAQTNSLPRRPLFCRKSEHGFEFCCNSSPHRGYRAIAVNFH